MNYESLARVACAIALSAAAASAQPGPIAALGAQLAGDGTFTEPSLTPQVGAIVGVRVENLSFRVVPSFGYVPLLGPSRPEIGEPPPPTGSQSIASHRFMTELRLEGGYSWFDRALEGRLFVSGRMVNELQPGRGTLTVMVDTGPPVVLPDPMPERVRDRYSVSGGTEWTWRPESSRQLEVTASLGVGALLQPHFRPDGTRVVDVSALVHGALAIGWLLDL